MLENEPDQAGRDRAHHQDPAEPSVGISWVDLALSERSHHSPDDPHPVLEEEAEEDHRRREVRRHQECQEELVVLMDVPAGEPRQDHPVPERGDRKWLGDALEEAEDDRLEIGDRVQGPGEARSGYRSARRPKPLVGPSRSRVTKPPARFSRLRACSTAVSSSCWRWWPGSSWWRSRSSTGRSPRSRCHRSYPATNRGRAITTSSTASPRSSWGWDASSLHGSGPGLPRARRAPPKHSTSRL